jgi:hypothetical protein
VDGTKISRERVESLREVKRNEGNWVMVTGLTEMDRFRVYLGVREKHTVDHVRVESLT